MTATRNSDSHAYSELAYTHTYSTRDVVVVGGGFIGLEIAQVAAAHGATVTVVEVADRLLGRAVSSSWNHIYANNMSVVASVC
ncbi:FAD-dependent oxidoreductase [Nocardia sp. NBC_01730]|uniref:FAD-dependent oxidoreductase n=1 Tax=Nocardia sp. NBC_01730 TaxID=2975998 RepID=UPI003FA35838